MYRTTTKIFKCKACNSIKAFGNLKCPGIEWNYTVNVYYSSHLTELNFQRVPSKHHWDGGVGNYSSSQSACYIMPLFLKFIGCFLSNRPEKVHLRINSPLKFQYVPISKYIIRLPNYCDYIHIHHIIIQIVYNF